MKYYTLFCSKIGNDVAKFVVYCSCDWRFEGLSILAQMWSLCLCLPRVVHSVVVGPLLFSCVCMCVCVGGGGGLICGFLV